MSLLTIKKVSDAGEKCWGIVLLDDNRAELLQSRDGVRKGEVTSIAKALKFEGPRSPIVVEGAAKPAGPAWVIEKAAEGWIVWFTPVGSTAFDVIVDAEDVAGSAEAAVKLIKDCLAHATIQWDPPEADPAYEEKVTDETEILGIPGSGAQLSPEMQNNLNQFARWTFDQVRVLESPVLLIFDYSPGAEHRPLSIAFDYGGGDKCWMTEAKIRNIENNAPRFHEDYREFRYEGRCFIPFSIRRFPMSIFEHVDELKGACRRLYGHVDWA